MAYEVKETLAIPDVKAMDPSKRYVRKDRTWLEEQGLRPFEEIIGLGICRADYETLVNMVVDGSDMNRPYRAAEELDRVTRRHPSPGVLEVYARLGEVGFSGDENPEWETTLEWKARQAFLFFE